MERVAPWHRDGRFFDGIVLHQILQWHHLLSAVDSQPWLDLRMQRVIDGLFHGLMYVVLAAGLVLLMKARHDFALSKADSYLFAGMLIGFGFGLWNVLDGLVFHWALQLHHIKTDATRPFVWDLVWFAVFGLLPLAIGYRLQRAAGRPVAPPQAALKQLPPAWRCWSKERVGRQCRLGVGCQAGCATT